MEKYYRTLRTSETGKKFQKIERNTIEADKAISELKNKYGFDNHYSSDEYAYGNIAAVVFPAGMELDMQAWKEAKNVGYNAYSPRLGNKKGKAIKKDFDAVPRAMRYDIDEIVGVQQVFQHIGFTMSDDTYFGFVVGAKWSVKIPKDCEEITASEYENLDNDKSTSNE